MEWYNSTMLAVTGLGLDIVGVVLIALPVLRDLDEEHVLADLGLTKHPTTHPEAPGFVYAARDPFSDGSNTEPNEVRVRRRLARWSLAGVVILVAGFTLQIFSNFA